jgi:triacylglycerol lipase
MPVTETLQFDPLTTRYTPGNAYWMARFSKWAYGQIESRRASKEQIRDALQRIDAKILDVEVFDASSSQGMVFQHTDYVVAAFRGTDEFADWLDNLNAVCQPGPLGGVHTGFYKALMDIWPAMKTKIRAWRKAAPDAADRPLWLTGHSLGGALATLAAATLIEADETFYGVYTFGSPRAGDRVFARTFNVEAKSRLFRFQNNSDIVTRIPARIMGYSHVGSFVYISEHGELHFDIGKWYRFMDTVKGVLSSIGEESFDSIEDHHIERYIDAIATYGDQPPQG